MTILRGVAVVMAGFAALGIVGALAPAAAATGDTVTVVYEFSADEFRTSLDGTVEPFVIDRPEPERIVLLCTDGECVFETAWGGVAANRIQLADAGAGAPFAVPGELTLSGPGAGTVCDASTLRPAWEVHIEFTADGVTGFARNEPTAADCPEGRLTSVGLSSEITTSIVAEGDCWFTEDGCFADAGGPVTDGETDADAEPATSSGSLLGTVDPAAPGVLSTLATPAQAGTAPSQLLVAIVLTIILVLLVAFPTSLLNSATEAASGRFSDWWAGRRARRAAVAAPLDPAAEASPSPAPSAGDVAPPRRPWSQSWWWAATGVVAASVVSSFVDPGFGLNPGSARVVLSILVSFAVDVVLGWALLVWLTRRLVPGATHVYAFQPFSLIVVVAAVVFTRVTGFEPGIVFGLVAGVAFGAMVGRAAQARGALTALGYGFAVALAAWLVYGAIGGGAAAGDSFWGTFVIETLSSIAIGGMAALPIALFPLRGLAGHAVFAWNRAVWAGCYALGLFAFFVVLMPMPFSWQGVGWDLAGWIVVYLAYAAFAVLAWLMLARPWRRRDDAADDAGDETSVPAAVTPASE